LVAWVGIYLSATAGQYAAPEAPLLPEGSGWCCDGGGALKSQRLFSWRQAYHRFNIQSIEGNFKRNLAAGISTLTFWMLELLLKIPGERTNKMDKQLYQQYLNQYVQGAIRESDGTVAGISERLDGIPPPGRFSRHREEKQRALADAMSAFSEHRHWPLDILLSHLGVETNP